MEHGKRAECWQERSGPQKNSQVKRRGGMEGEQVSRKKRGRHLMCGKRKRKDANRRTHAGGRVDGATECARAGRESDVRESRTPVTHIHTCACTHTFCLSLQARCRRSCCRRVPLSLLLVRLLLGCLIDFQRGCLSGYFRVFLVLLAQRKMVDN